MPKLPETKSIVIERLESYIRKSFLFAAAWLVFLFFAFTTLLVDMHFPVWIEWFFKITAGAAITVAIFWSFIYLLVMIKSKNRRQPLLIAAFFQISGYVIGGGWYIATSIRLNSSVCKNLYDPNWSHDRCYVEGKSIIGMVVIIPFLLSLFGLLVGLVGLIARLVINKSKRTT